jgi:glycosyltransferase involved in cell wall biosynthesis
MEVSGWIVIFNRFKCIKMHSIFKGVIKQVSNKKRNQKIKVLINTSNLYVGGGVQVALSFINELKELDTGNEYYIFLSQSISKQINQKKFSKNFHFYLIERSPASLKTRKKTISQLNALEFEIQPDIVFSVFGPSYWRPKAKHIMGFAVPWVLQKDSVAYGELNFLKRIKMRLWVEYVSYYSKIGVSHYIIETEDGKNKLSNVLGIEKNKISVVGNSCSAVFNDSDYLLKNNPNYIQLPVRGCNEFRFLLISHNHPHKNLKIINQVIPLLKSYNVKFILTVDEESYNLLFPDKPKQVLNIGPVNQESCPSLYCQCDAIFLPTLLEVFSATYPEAMKMEIPILTSNYSFSKDVCHEAASYFNPLDPIDIADKIKMLISDQTLQINLVKKGVKQLKYFETAKSRAEKYITICENLVNRSW